MSLVLVYVARIPDHTSLNSGISMGPCKSIRAEETVAGSRLETSLLGRHEAGSHKIGGCPCKASCRRGCSPSPAALSLQAHTDVPRKEAPWPPLPSPEREQHREQDAVSDRVMLDPSALA